MSVTAPSWDEFNALAARVEAVETLLAAAAQAEPESPFMTIKEASLFIGSGHIPCDGHRQKPCKGDQCRRCHGTGQLVNRARIDDLLSRGTLTRFKEGGRTLVSRTEIKEHIRTR